MAPQAVESGVSRQEFYFVRETTNSAGEPVAPTDPTFRLYSSAVSSMESEANPSFEARVGIGEWIGQDKTRSQEENELTVGYDLEKFFVDGSGNAHDAFYDVCKRTIDHTVENTHSVLRVEQFAELAQENTVHYRYFSEDGNTHPSGTDPGAPTDLATRKETYARGCTPEEGTLTLNPGDSATATVEITYIPRKIRVYQFDQPSSSTTLHVRSSDSSDTGVTVSLESEDGSTSEDVSLDGTDATTAVQTTASFASLRAECTAEQTGTIEIYTDDGAGNTETLLGIIPGAAAREGIESDDGVPMVGAGSFEDQSATGIGEGIPAALAGDVTFEANNAAQYLGELEFTVSNEVSDQTTGEGVTRFIAAGSAEVTLTASVFGQTENVDYFQRMMAGSEGQLKLPMTAGDMTLPRAYVDEISDEIESGSAVTVHEATFMALDPSSGDPIQFTAN